MVECGWQSESATGTGNSWNWNIQYLVEFVCVCWWCLCSIKFHFCSAQRIFPCRRYPTFDVTGMPREHSLQRISSIRALLLLLLALLLLLLLLCMFLQPTFFGHVLCVCVCIVKCQKSFALTCLSSFANGAPGDDSDRKWNWVKWRCYSRFVAAHARPIHHWTWHTTKVNNGISARKQRNEQILPNSRRTIIISGRNENSIVFLGDAGSLSLCFRSGHMNRWMANVFRMSTYEQKRAESNAGSHWLLHQPGAEQRRKIMSASHTHTHTRNSMDSFHLWLQCPLEMSQSRSHSHSHSRTAQANWAPWMEQQKTL